MKHVEKTEKHDILKTMVVVWRYKKCGLKIMLTLIF